MVGGYRSGKQTGHRRPILVTVVDHRILVQGITSSGIENLRNAEIKVLIILISALSQHQGLVQRRVWDLHACLSTSNQRGECDVAGAGDTP